MTKTSQEISNQSEATSSQNISQNNVRKRKNGIDCTSISQNNVRKRKNGIDCTSMLQKDKSFKASHQQLLLEEARNSSATNCQPDCDERAQKGKKRFLEANEEESPQLHNPNNSSVFNNLDFL